MYGCMSLFHRSQTTRGWTYDIPLALLNHYFAVIRLFERLCDVSGISSLGNTNWNSFGVDTVESVVDHM